MNNEYDKLPEGNTIEIIDKIEAGLISSQEDEGDGSVLVYIQNQLRLIGLLKIYVNTVFQRNGELAADNNLKAIMIQDIYELSTNDETSPSELLDQITNLITND